ncbi:hypothetical protein O181_008453 [Austropuccinia psidii MF-1]|uniref:RNase H type-1 domain-containing protein n=1 Tax=Austropuccinia psidii MF-1 TaxID=1389203 RepID=A0A9Q3BP56_9BASI|nr:hypothetical protein [Austropuccinia psidii MF-1]
MGIQILNQWLQTEAKRQTPTLIIMDSNLHHPLWNPRKYTHTHSQEKYIIKACGKKGFYLVSPKHTPTFLGAVGKPTTIDLTWVNHTTQKLQPTTQVQLNNHSLDHHPIITKITLPNSETHTPKKHLSIWLENLNNKLFLETLQLHLAQGPANTDHIEATSQNLSTAIMMAYNNQGKWVITNPARAKAWWDKDQLNELVKIRNKARIKMLRAQTNQSREEYYHYQKLFKQKVWELKSGHWRKFLAEKGLEHAYQAHKFTKNRQEEVIASLRNQEVNLTSDIKEKELLLFYGTSLVETVASLDDIPQWQESIPFNFPQVTEDKVVNEIAELPNKKAPGPDGIPNKLIKLSKMLLTPTLTTLYNLCFKQGRYPEIWKESQTAIIRKAAKDNYTSPNAYRPIALLNTLGKLFEKIINNCLMHWAYQTRSIHPGHVGGRLGKRINYVFIMLTSWITNKWRKGRIVMRIFFDVKSAYPSVHKKRLTHVLKQKICPPYLGKIIDSFLTDRMTSLKIGDYISQTFSVLNGLPKGSLLSVTLYLIYNSSLLLPNPPSLNANNIPIAYIDNMTHLIAADNTQQAQSKAKEIMARSKKWGSRYGAIFDEKKTNFMLFTRKRQPINKITTKGSVHTLQKEIKWLCITLTPTLSPGPHLRAVNIKTNSIIKQLTQIIRPTFGLCQREERILIAAVMSTRILHGSIIWYTSKNLKTVEKLLTNGLFQAVRLSTGMMRQTPFSFLKLYGGIKELTKQHTKLTHNYIHTKLAAPIDNAHRKLIWRDLMEPQRTHPSPLNNLIGKDALLRQHFTRTETISPFLIMPWSTQIVNITNSQLTKEQAKEKVPEQVKCEMDENSLVFFADGSLIPGKGGGAAATLANTQTKQTTYVGRNSIITNFETELMPLFLYSQAALKSITLPKKKMPGQQLIIKIFNRFQWWSQDFTIKLYWYPGHTGIQQNEEVDRLAKEAATSETRSQHTLHHISISKLKQTTNQTSRTPPELTDTELARVKFKTPPSSLSKHLTN